MAIQSLPLFVTAMVIEAKGLLPFLTDAPSGDFEDEGGFLRWRPRNETPWNLVVTGVGPEISATGLEKALDRTPNVSAVIGFGFAGGLVKTARSGDVVIASSIVFEKRELVPTEWLRTRLLQGLDSTPLKRLLTVNELLSSRADKAALYAATGAEAVDMESGAWGEVAISRGLPWGIARSVLDTAEETIPPTFSALMDQYGNSRWLTSLKYFSRHPKDLRAAIDLRRSVRTNASPALGKVASSWLRSEEKPGAKQA